MSNTVSASQGYSVDRTYPLERQRLDLLTQLCDGWSRANLERAGLSAGWRCLEVGAGNGSVAAWLADRVGPQGSCVAIDIDLRFLDDAAARGVEVLERDVLADDFPDQSFDLIHTRAVVMHLAEPERAVERMVRWLRPGGVLVLEEPDGLVARHTEDPVWQRFWSILPGFPIVDHEFGRSLPRRLATAGLVDVAADGWLPTIRGGSTEAEYYRMSVAAFGPAVVRAGAVSQADLDAMVERIGQPDFLEFGFMWVSCSGRRPG